MSFSDLARYLINSCHQLVMSRTFILKQFKEMRASHIFVLNYLVNTFRNTLLLCCLTRANLYHGLYINWPGFCQSISLATPRNNAPFIVHPFFLLFLCALVSAVPNPHAQVSKRATGLSLRGDSQSSEPGGWKREKVLRTSPFSDDMTSLAQEHTHVGVSVRVIVAIF
ncbi:hypothetical protein BJV74DRAFT_538404 [Russula compacta]|nr:hypothetical protein BJV74DRAFT_538404 [Russula compacta]